MKNWINGECNKEDIVVNSNICLSRNLKEKPFPNKLDEIQSRENAGFIYQIIRSEIEEDSCIYQLWNEDKEVINSFLDKQLISRELIKNRNKTAFILNSKETLSIMINEDDHLKLKGITAGFDLDSAFDSITKLDDKIEKRVHYAFDDNFGYLTTSPTNLGTGMRAAVTIHLPALNFNNEIKNFSKGLTQIGMDMKSIYEEDNKNYGNLYKISNQATLGLTEKEIIDNLKGAVSNIISEEKKFREVLLSKCKYDIEDKIFRAYGILTSAVLLNEKECTELLSDLRFGIELGLINISLSKLNKLLVYTRNSSLQNYLKRQLSNKEFNYERAKLVKSVLA